MRGLLVCAVTLLFGFVAPVALMRPLAAHLAHVAPRVRNYRGKMVYTGLGVVWVIWMAGLMLAQDVLEAGPGGPPPWLDVITTAAPLVMGSCALGMFDDMLGGSERAKGFAGHFRALRAGEFTTGMTKLVGIGVLSLATAARVSGEPVAEPAYVAAVVLRALVMALTANEMNLFDLRPARALKAYVIVLLACGVGFMAWQRDAWGAVWVGVVVALSLAPVAAVWRFDAGELGMMGDAGSNAMGAYLGFMMACTMPLPALAAACVLLVAMNLASERVSYSAVIERNRLLSWVDRLGRPRE